MNNKGFAVSSILYIILLVFLSLIMMLLFDLQNKKNLLDEMKSETYESISSPHNFYENGTIVYFNAETGNVCSETTYNNNSNASSTENKSGCMKWYVFNDNIDNDTVNLILDHNTTAVVRWNSNGQNQIMNEVLSKLTEDISTWKSELDARIISANEVAKIVGTDLNDSLKWDSNKIYGTNNIDTESSYFYFDGSGNTYSGWQTATALSKGASKYSWLYDMTYSCEQNGCNKQDNNLYSNLIGGTSVVAGYWTSTGTKKNNNEVWFITKSGNLGDDLSSNSNVGIRPVITISKDTLTNYICEYDVGKEWTFDYTGGEQTFTVPCDGNYKLEIWGAQGGSISGYTGGAGGYSKGNIILNVSDKLFINVGGAGVGAISSGQSLAGGYNGGGSVIGNSSVNHINASGGGATSIANVSGLLSSLSSNKQAILIVAGGGGGARNQANHVSAARWGNGGAGGGLSGTGAYSSYGSTNSYTTVDECAGTQNSGNKFGEGGTSTGNSGGGGGYYGGYDGSGTECGYTGCGSGGSGYIDVLTDASSENGIRSGNGYAKIIYLGN